MFLSVTSTKIGTFALNLNHNLHMMSTIHNPSNPSATARATVAPSVTPVILCGGSGTRLWPLSRKSLPKQFVPLIDGKSLLALTIERLQALSHHMLLVASEEHRFLLADTLEDAQVQGDLILEPHARNTAAAMGLAALWMQDQHHRQHPEELHSNVPSKGSPLLLFCPSDHHIPDIPAFEHTVRAGVASAESGAIVTFGVHPSSPSSAYGYIHFEKNSNPQSLTVSKVRAFVEKPNVQTAQTYLLSGEYLWNAGIFLTRCDTLLDALKRHAPDILLSCQAAMKSPRLEHIQAKSVSMHSRFVRPDADALLSCRSESIDYAVMEHHPKIEVVSFEGQWSDVGSWNAVSDLTPKNQEGNQIVGQGLAHQTHNTFIHAPNRTVVALGVEDLLIIDTPDALLVADRAHAEGVKAVVALLEKNNDPKALLHRKVHRPWGWYDSIDQGERFQVKRICVKPGASLSLQKHHHRAEHWIVVKGAAEVTKGEEVFLLGENQSTYIPIGEVHRLHNPGVTELEMIEVQSGSYLGEDDIVRFEDTYGRVK